MRVFGFFHHNGLLNLRLVCRAWARVSASCIRVMRGRIEAFSKELSEVFCGLDNLVFGSDQHVNAQVIAALGGRVCRIKRLKVDLKGWDRNFGASFSNLEHLAVGGHRSQESGFGEFLSTLKKLRYLRVSVDALSLLPHVAAPLRYLCLPPDAEAFPVIVQKFSSSLERLEFIGDVSLVMDELPALPNLRHLTMSGWYWTPTLQHAIQNLEVLWTRLERLYADLLLNSWRAVLRWLIWKQRVNRECRFDDAIWTSVFGVTCVWKCCISDYRAAFALVSERKGAVHTRGSSFYPFC